jgi:hypothetical protein
VQTQASFFAYMDGFPLALTLRKAKPGSAKSAH